MAASNSVNKRTILENDLTDTETIYNCISIADFLILEPLYKLIFFRVTLGHNNLDTGIEGDTLMNMALRSINSTIKFHHVFSQLHTFAGGDETFEGFVRRVLSRRGVLLQKRFPDFKISPSAGVYRWDGTDVQTDRYFQMIFSHIRYITERDRMCKDSERAMKGMMSMLDSIGGKAGFGDIFPGDLSSVFGRRDDRSLTTESGRPIAEPTTAAAALEDDDDDSEEEVEIEEEESEKN